MNEQSRLPYSLPPAVERISSAMKWGGRIGFWVQLVLGVISAVILLVSVPGLLSGSESGAGTGFGIVCAIGGVLTLVISTYFCFRYMDIAKRLRLANPSERPTKTNTLKLIKTGLILNLVGILLTVIGAQAIVGTMLLTALKQSPGLGVDGASSRFVLPIDVFVVQANTNTIAAHVAGIISSLWLLDKINS